MTSQEKAAKTAVLRTQFPVSSGSDHRSKESEWVPVMTGAISTTAAEDKVFHEPPSNVSCQLCELSLIFPVSHINTPHDFIQHLL